MRRLLVPGALCAATLAAGLACVTLIGSPTATPTAAPTATPTAPPTATAPPATETPAPTDLPAPEEFDVPVEGANHIPEGQPGNYNHYPPSSGQHYPRTLFWDFFVDEIPPEYYVHNLEHGGIVVLYNCPTACPATEDKLEEFFNSAEPEEVFNEVKIVIGQNTRIEQRVVALAWGRQLNLPDADVDILLDFYNRHVNQGPELAP